MAQSVLQLVSNQTVISEVTKNAVIINQTHSSNVVTSPIGQGPAGRDGVQSNISPYYIASTDLGGGRVVRVTIDGKVSYCSNLSVDESSSVVGITTTSAVQNSTVSVQYAGVMEDSTWSWNPTHTIYCGDLGVLTQQVPTEGCIVPVAIALSSTKILVLLKQILLLSN